MNLDRMTQKDYRSIPFYSLNDKLEEGKIREQIRFMHAQGMGGFFLHARGGLETEYLSQEWFSIMAVAVDEAKKMGMYVWFYDEEGWPSGFAGGKLLTEENYVMYLELKEEAAFAANALSCFVKEGETYRRADGTEKANIFFNVYGKYNHSYVDLLDPEVTKRFIRCTHEEYYTRFQNEFGKTVAGFFTDEPQYFRDALPWSKVIPSEFLKTYGYDVRDGLIWLFKGQKEGYPFRNDYWTLVNRLFVEGYQKQVFEWCEAHGCLCTGHTIEETSLYGQMMCCAGAMPYYEYLHIPGIDWLTNFVYNEISPKQLTSVCDQLGKNVCITETFGASGHAATPLDLKGIAQFQYVAGVSLMCQHLLPYSVRGLRKRDYPPYFSQHSLWTDCSAGFNEYFARLGQIVAENKEQTDILLLHPMRSAYVLYDKYDPSTLAEVETSFHETAAYLVQNHLPHHFGDERLMEKYGKVQDGKLVVGEQRYSVVIIPRCINMSKSVFSLLKEFVAQGGKLALVNSPEYIEGRKTKQSLQANCTKEELASSSRTVVSGEGCEFLRSRRSKDWLYILSCTKERIVRAHVVLRGVQSVCGYDAEKDKYYAVRYEREQDGIALDLSFEKYGSFLLRLNREETEERCFTVKSEEDITAHFGMEVPSHNYLPLDFAQISKDGEHFSECMPLCKIMDKILYERYEGDICLKFSFVSQGVSEPVFLGTEMLAGAEYFFNGIRVSLKGGKQNSASELFFYPLGTPREGENVLQVKLPFRQSAYIYHVLFDEGVTETLRNKLTLKTELETPYIAGRFSIKSEKTEDLGSFTAIRRELKIGKAKVGEVANITRSGYPFLHEKICLKGTVKCSVNGRTYLKILHKYDAVTVFVNGRKAGDITFTEQLEISDLVREGGNELSLFFSPSSQNFFGPFHFKEYDTTAVTPYCFGYQNNYCGDDPNWTDTYYVKNQGVDAIILLQELDVKKNI